MQHGGAATSSKVSKVSKFFTLRNLPAADTVTLSAAVPPCLPGGVRLAEPEDGCDVATNTVRLVQESKQTEENDDETDERIRQHRYAQLVNRLSAQRSQYHSASVFVEAMLKETQHSADGSPATQAAVATWGLKILAREARSMALTAVMDSLLPALYCKYEPGQVCTASPAVQLQVRDRDVIDDNPYFTHAMFVDEAQSGKLSATRLRQSLEAAVKANDERRNVVMRLVGRERRMRLCAVFRGWRSHMHQNRLVQLISDSKAKRGAEEAGQLRKQAVFYQWKLLVERSRSAYLTERLHDAAFQLENAKNQFQLQCYRADRLVQAAKEASDEAVRVTELNINLAHEVAELKEERVRREKEFRRLLTQSVSRLLRLLSTYDELSRIFVQSKTAAAQESCTSAVASDVDRVSPVDTPEEVETTVASSSGSSLERLRRWADGVLAEVQGRETPFRPISRLGSDFADGERYLCLLHHVFPGIVASVLSVQSMGVETRMRRIRDCAMQCKLRYILLPSDFINEREDLLVCSLSELQQRHLTRLWKESAEKSAAELGEFRERSLTATVEACAATPTHTKEGGDTPAVEPKQEEEETKLLDSATVTAHIADFVQRLQRTGEELETAFSAEADVVEGSIAIAEEEARLGSERLRGAPVPVVEEASRRVFWQLAPETLNDLREETQLSVESAMWEFVTTQALPAVLRDHVDIISRLFFFFAGENAKTLSEVAFWRFVEASGILVGPLEVPKSWIVLQYDRVVSPQLDAVIKTTARNQNEMNVQKLRRVTYQEMDIRSATPGQFVELLVRIAVGAENGEFGLVEGSRRLLQRLQLPNREKMTVVEEDIYTPDMQSVLHYFSEDLFRTFIFYVKQQESSRNAQERAMAQQDGGRFSAQMSVSTLLSFLDDCRYLSDGSERGTAAPLAADATRLCFFVCTAQIRRLVPLLARQCKVPNPTYLSFGLFVDALAAVAYHWCPDPLVPAPRRLAAFLSYTTQQLNARHSNSTLLLGSAPTISLDGGKTVDFSQEARPISGSL
ncbi:hypothetical protein ABB37_07078 [Leptomonas pyrrhocoris]|uniref:Uncharacterized protein n=1 Tax=Leptomonas pyrrhocoris TaxID=157538 RepID=A0A0M9FW38_LEPPY|nr:hypothetical protein ABB37_07078 [Leptomonas pyrrhocoris]KPA77147.1 hypothetical protein ABB37_07078 [Leptomonas pyrrhocoris]|eukprot:XP_015655586.1 hypothetical protein ABB37_07078 [Leptomonas pyrrhocoris]